MADIRIKDLTTTASSSASDDFIAIDGTTNGTRKLNAFSPTFGGNATVTGTLTVSGNTTLSGNLDVASGISTGTAQLQIGNGRTGSGYAYVDLVGDTTYSDYGFRIIRNNGGANTSSELAHRGTGDFALVANDAAPIKFYTNGVTAATIAATTGNTTIHSTTASTTTSSGALVVSGGVGVGGAINAGVGTHSFGTSAGGGVNNFGALLTYFNIRSTSDSDNPIFRVYDGRVNVSAFEVNARTQVVTLSGTTASTSTSSGALVVSGGVGVAGNTNIGGVASVGGSSNAAVGVYVINTALTGTDQYGVASEPIWTSAATSGHTIWARTKTAASAFTLTHGQAFFVDLPTLGSGSSITNIYGMRIRNQGTTGVTNAYGLYVESQSGAATVNYAIYTAGGRINFQGLPTSSAGLPAGTLWNDGGTLKVA